MLNSKLITDEAQTELAKAIPALNAAAEALKTASYRLKNFSNPPPALSMLFAFCWERKETGRVLKKS